MTDNFLEAKIAELMKERFNLQGAMMRAREALEQGRTDAAYTILGTALGLTATAKDEDFEAQRRLAEQSLERD